ncbi:hypothetical protein BpHYR1_043601 [Brachionus plicatilis]|uniref:Uncharacterized protein n=1 Tax=Brachionus plicatilis TaxID=10195 RepID=A0A3M7T868_BRAPC|nr:hypothetical protein BpHYR1_043601 [Brachionus plicatilis]
MIKKQHFLILTGILKKFKKITLTWFRWELFHIEFRYIDHLKKSLRKTVTGRIIISESPLVP